MLKAFRDYIRSEVTKRVLEADSHFVIRKRKLGSPYSGSLVLEKRVCDQFSGFIHIQFVAGRNYVIPSVQWSTTGNYPDEATSREIQLTLFSRGMTCEAIRDELAEGWLRATDFGRAASHFELVDEKPPRDVIRAAYATPRAQKILAADPFLKDGVWEGNPDFDNWDVMVAVTGIEPTFEDALLAVGALTDQLSDYVRSIYIPFLNSARVCEQR